MTPNPSPDRTESARSTPDLALAHARPAGTNGHQKPSRRQQMLYAATHAAQVLEEAAEHEVDPAELRLAAEGLRYAALRLGSPKPRRQQRLPRPGDATRLVQQLSSVELDEAAASIVNEALARLRESTG